MPSKLIDRSKAKNRGIMPSKLIDRSKAKNRGIMPSKLIDRSKTNYQDSNTHCNHSETIKNKWRKVTQIYYSYSRIQFQSKARKYK